MNTITNELPSVNRDEHNICSDAVTNQRESLERIHKELTEKRSVLNERFIEAQNDLGNIDDLINDVETAQEHCDNLELVLQEIDPTCRS